MGLLDEGLTTEKKQERWARFAGTTFGIAPVEEWPQLRRDLLEFEGRLACHQ